MIDHFNINLYSVLADARSVAFVSPSVTPWLHEGGVNPSLRLYHYASEGIKDYWY